MNNLKYFIISTLFALAASQLTVHDRKVVCFWNPMASNRNGKGIFTVRDIDPHLCTHLVYGYFQIESDGSIFQPQLGNVDEYFIYNFVKLRKINPNLKIFASIGGPDFSSEIFEKISSDATKRATFADRIFQFLRDFNFDGVDLYWTFPKTSTKTGFVNLLAGIDKILKQNNKSLTISATPNEKSPSEMYQLNEIVKYVDFVNLDIARLYDIYGISRVAIPHSPFKPLVASDKLNLESIVSNWISQKFPIDKIIPGIPTYGRSYTLKNSYYFGVSSEVISNGNRGEYGAENIRKVSILPFSEICYNLEHNLNWRRFFHEKSRSPYAVYNTNQWISFDDVGSVKDKTRFVINDKNLTGIAFYDLDMDDFANDCGYGKFPLIKAAIDVINGEDSPVPETTPDAETTTSTTTTTTTSTTTTTPLPEFSCRGRPDGNYQNPGNCNTFYSCANGYRYLMVCPNGLYYNEESDMCLHLPSGNCIVIR